MADDGGVDEHVQRLGGEHDEGGQGEPGDPPRRDGPDGRGSHTAHRRNRCRKGRKRTAVLTGPGPGMGRPRGHHDGCVRAARDRGLRWCCCRVSRRLHRAGVSARGLSVVSGCDPRAGRQGRLGGAVSTFLPAPARAHSSRRATVCDTRSGCPVAGGAVRDRERFRTSVRPSPGSVGPVVTRRRADLSQVTFGPTTDPRHPRQSDLTGEEVPTHPPPEPEDRDPADRQPPDAVAHDVRADVTEARDREPSRRAASSTARTARSPARTRRSPTPA